MQTPVPWVGQDGCRERCMGKEYQQLGSPGRLKLRGSGHTAWKGDSALRQKMYIWSFGWWTEPGTRLPREAMESPSWIVLLLLALAVCGSRLTHSTAAWYTDRPHHGTTAYFPLFPSSESFSSPEFISWNKVAYNIFHSQAFNLVMLSSSMKAVGELYFWRNPHLSYGWHACMLVKCFAQSLCLLLPALWWSCAHVAFPGGFPEAPSGTHSIDCHEVHHGDEVRMILQPERWIPACQKGHSSIQGASSVLIDRWGNVKVSSHPPCCGFLSTKPFYFSFWGTEGRCCIFCFKALGLELHLWLSLGCYIKVGSKKLKPPG